MDQTIIGWQVGWGLFWWVMGCLAGLTLGVLTVAAAAALISTLDDLWTNLRQRLRP